MKLYFSNELYGGLPSPWTAAAYPIPDVPAAGEFNVKDLLVDNRVIPCYLLKTTPGARGTLSFTRQCKSNGNLHTWDHTLEQMFSLGVALKGSGTIGYSWVHSTTLWATSTIRTKNWSGNGSGTGIFIPFVYLWRPSTQQRVAILVQPNMGYAASTINTIAYNSSTLLYNNNNESPWYGLVWNSSFPVNPTGQYTRSNSAYQDGDMIIWEVWGYPQSGGVGQSATGWYNYTLNFDIGGTTYDQPYNTSLNSQVTRYTSFLYLDDLQNTTAGVYAIPQGVGQATLIDVSPKADGVECTFDSAVAISPSLTLGSPAAGLRALGATSTSDTVKKLNIKPVPPSVNLGF
jgi:hypothetical protein